MQANEPAATADNTGVILSSVSALGCMKISNNIRNTQKKSLIHAFEKPKCLFFGNVILETMKMKRLLPLQATEILFETKKKKLHRFSIKKKRVHIHVVVVPQKWI